MRIRKALDPEITLAEAKAFLIRTRFRRKIRHIMFDRAISLAVMTVCPLIMLCRNQRAFGKRVIVDLNATPKVRDTRQRFIQKHAPSKEAGLEYIPLVNGRHFVYGTFSLNDARRVFKLWLLFWWAAATGLFYRAPIPLVVLPFDFMAVASLTCLPDVECYFFALRMVDTYLIARLAEMHGGPKVIVSLGNGSSYENRYTYLPQSSLIACTACHKPEVAAFTERHWLRVTEANFWGLEDTEVEDLLPMADPPYDVGIYSSGEWGRIQGLYRLSFLSRAARLPENPGNEAFVNEVLNPLLEMAEAGEIKVKLYLHPYERQLLHDYGIRPPYWDAVEAAHVDVDDAPGSSVQQMPECHVGVSLSSSMIMDRWHIGLPGLLYTGPENVDSYDVRYMGRFRDNFFTNRQEMQMRLRAILSQQVAEV